jgi:hypothetical protein
VTRRVAIPMNPVVHPNAEGAYGGNGQGQNKALALSELDECGLIGSNWDLLRGTPNEMLISCKRPVITYGPLSPLGEPSAQELLRPARVCRLH